MKRHHREANKFDRRSETNLSTPMERIPDELFHAEANEILAHAREELDVSRSRVAKTPFVKDDVVESFETVGFPINQHLWKAYVAAIENRHEISRARASGLLQGLVKETAHYKDHKRF